MVPNQGRFHYVVLLSAPLSVILDRVANRSNNPYGKAAEHRAEIERYLGEIEPPRCHRGTRRPAPTGRVGRRRGGSARHIALILSRGLGNRQAMADGRRSLTVADVQLLIRPVNGRSEPSKILG
jgi:hypothetical protein